MGYGDLSHTEVITSHEAKLVSQLTMELRSCKFLVRILWIIPTAAAKKSLKNRK